MAALRGTGDAAGTLVGMPVISLLLFLVDLAGFFPAPAQLML